MNVQEVPYGHIRFFIRFHTFYMFKRTKKTPKSEKYFHEIKAKLS